MTTVAFGAAVHPDTWLTEVMGIPVFRAEVDDGAERTASLTEILGEHIAGRQAAMYYTKVPTDRVSQLHALEAAGFSVIEVAVTLAFEAATPPAAAPDVTVAALAAEQAAAVLEIAGSCFRYSRFHTDPRVPLVVAHRVKREWIRSYVEGRRGDPLLVATLDGTVAGFLAPITGHSGGVRTCTIDLVGVAGWAQRRGVGRALVQAFLDRYADAASRLQVGTQIVNVPSLRLYHALGFVLTHSQYVLHRHVGSIRAAAPA